MLTVEHSPPASQPRVPRATTKGRVLVVDDELAILRAYTKALSSGGYEVVAVTDGVMAQEAIRRGRFDAILSDVWMPGMDGLGLLGAVRGLDPDVPVIFITGSPTPEGATSAIEAGALLYLVKPIDFRALHQVVEHACRLHRMAKLKRDAIKHLGATGRMVGDLAGLEVRFASALGSLWIAYQPIVRWSSREVFGYEALVRSGEPLLGTPADLFDAAVRLDRVGALGRAMRALIAPRMVDLPAGTKMFVNVHTSDLADPALLTPEEPLAPFADRVVLEVTERASLDAVRDLPLRAAALRRRGFRLAVDDLGAGYAGLTALAQLTPEVAKVDMSLVRGVDEEPIKQRIVRAMTDLGKEMGMLIVTEGVETPGERDALADLGCDLMQGYLFGRPEKGFQPPSW